MRIFRPLSVLLLFFCFDSYGQNKNKSCDFILMIDNEIVVGGIDHICLDITDSIGKDTTIQLMYHPGRLSLSSVDNEYLSKHSNKILLRFNYSDYSLKEARHYNYEFEFNKKWLEEEFLIFYVFNIDKKEFRKYPPLSIAQNYTFCVTSPNYTFARIVKK